MYTCHSYRCAKLYVSVGSSMGRVIGEWISSWMFFQKKLKENTKRSTRDQQSPRREKLFWLLDGFCLPVDFGSLFANARTVLSQMVTQSSPSPALSCVEKAPQRSHVSHITIDDSDHNCSESSNSNALQDVHISARLMEDFIELAKDNTEKDLETCGVLGAFLERGIFYVTTLIIPKQESSSNSCLAVNEEEVFAIQNEQSLYPVGWIHTHPSQSCFMSSIDLHTHYSYQVMVPEAFAIVVAPTDNSRSYGIFRLSDPGGMKIVRDCHETGFHPHKEPEDGGPLYENCSNVYKNSNLRFEIFDLR